LCDDTNASFADEVEPEVAALRQQRALAHCLEAGIMVFVE
jgi:hypothetical protein